MIAFFFSCEFKVPSEKDYVEEKTQENHTFLGKSCLFPVFSMMFS